MAWQIGDLAGNHAGHMGLVTWDWSWAGHARLGHLIYTSGMSDPGGVGAVVCQPGILTVCVSEPALSSPYHICCLAFDRYSAMPAWWAVHHQQHQDALDM